MRVKANLTPSSLLCALGTCPAVYELHDGTLAIVGDQADAEVSGELKDKVAPHEVVALIKPEYLAEIIQQQKSKK